MSAIEIIQLSGGPFHGKRDFPPPPDGVPPELVRLSTTVRMSWSDRSEYQQEDVFYVWARDDGRIAYYRPTTPADFDENDVLIPRRPA